jgi:ATP-dependent protease ClpP protease subunit
MSGYSLVSKKRKYIDYAWDVKKKHKKEKKERDKTEQEEIEEGANILGNLGINLLGGDGSSSATAGTKNKKIERDANHIYFYSEVNRDAIYELISLINEIEEENKMLSFKMKIEPIPIYLHISSYGGCVFSAFNVIDIIKACEVPIYSIIEGCAASAGTLMSVVCDKRFIRPSSYMLIHQLSSGCWGKMCEIEDEVENLKDFMERIKSIYIENTKIPKKELTELLKHDLWLNSNKCLKYSLVDEIM